MWEKRERIGTLRGREVLAFESRESRKWDGREARTRGTGRKQDYGEGVPGRVFQVVEKRGSRDGAGWPTVSMESKSAVPKADSGAASRSGRRVPWPDGVDHVQKCHVRVMRRSVMGLSERACEGLRVCGR